MNQPLGAISRKKGLRRKAEIPFRIEMLPKGGRDPRLSAPSRWFPSDIDCVCILQSRCYNPHRPGFEGGTLIIVAGPVAAPIHGKDLISFRYSSSVKARKVSVRMLPNEPIERAILAVVSSSG